MIKIQIGSCERNIEEITKSWLIQQIEKRRQDGAPICIRVFIKKSNIDIVLSTYDCPKSKTTIRRATNIEKKIFNHWERLGLNKENFDWEMLLSFLNQVS